MRLLRISFAAVLFAILPGTASMAQAPQGSSSVPTFRVKSTLIFLDVTVLDKKGNPVVTGLTKDDFIVTENKKPQRIFSFEPPESHVLTPNAGDENPEGKAPVTIFVLDLLNSSFQDFAFIRYSVRRYLNSQPAQLTSPAELIVIGNDSLEMLQGFTRNKADLLYALDHLPPILPYKQMIGSFYWERFAQSIDALQQIALQNKGVPGRKNIIWVGHGGPGINLGANILTGQLVDRLKQYVHDTTNMLVDSRVSLFVIYPGLKVNNVDMSKATLEAAADIGNGDSDPFSGDINFGVFVNETGGRLYYDRNDVDRAIDLSQHIGSSYYTLTYQPHDTEENGKFRRIRVSVRNQRLQVITKSGYFAPDAKQPVDPRQQTIVNIVEAARSTLPLTVLGVKVSGVVRHPDTRTAEVTVLLSGKNLDWQVAENGRNTAKIILAAVSLSARQDILASNVKHLTLSGSPQDPAQLSEMAAHAALTVRVLRRTQNVRVVMETEEGERIGAADVGRKIIDAAPAAETPDPKLVPKLPVDLPPPAP